MMTRWLIVASLCIAASTADAKNLRLDKDGLTAWVPDQWAVQNIDGGYSATAPNQAASAIFMSQAIRDLDLAYKNMPAVMCWMLPNIQFGQPARVNIANLSAIVIKGIGDHSGQKIEANVATLITPGQRALYVITLVQAESASSFDATIRKILYGLAASGGAPVGGPGPAQPQPSRDNACWEMKSHPNGWSRKEWRGLSFLLPQGWSFSETRDPNTDQPYITITDRSSTIMVFQFAAARHDAAWQALGSQIAGYGLGEVAWGTVEGQRALCAKGSSSDGVVFHRGQTALGMFGRAAGDPSLMRGILGSMRWR